MNQEHPDVWLKIFIAIGAVASLFFLLFPVLVQSQMVAEKKRFEACQKHQRVDCDSSLLWMVQGLKNVADVR